MTTESEHFSTKLHQGCKLSESVLRDILHFHFRSAGIKDIRDFLNDDVVFHKLFQLYIKSYINCKCGNPLQNKKSGTIKLNQWEILYKTDATKKHGYKPNPLLTLEHLDATLSSHILLNIILFSHEYLPTIIREHKYSSLEDLVKTSQHYLWASWKRNEKCNCGIKLKYHGGKLSEIQWKTLFKDDPSSACKFSVKDTVSTEDIDDETIEAILRNDPQKCMEVENIEKIRNVRNRISHSGDTWDETNFKSEWGELKSSVLKLAGRISTKHACFYERRFEEIEYGKGYYIMMNVSNRPENVRKRIDSCMKEIKVFVLNTKFISTMVYRNAYKMLFENKFVALTGHPGEGKTAIAYNITWESFIEAKSLNIESLLIIRSAKDWKKYVDSWHCENTTIVMDDFLGRFPDIHNKKELQEWISLIPSVKSKVVSGNNSFVLVISGYSYNFYKSDLEYQIIKAFQNKSSIVEVKTSEDEKVQILELYAPKLENKTKVVTEFCCFGFPKYCSMLEGRSYINTKDFLAVTRSDFLESELKQLPYTVHKFLFDICSIQSKRTHISDHYLLRNNSISGPLLSNSLLEICTESFICRDREHGLSSLTPAVRDHMKHTIDPLSKRRIYTRIRTFISNFISLIKGNVYFLALSLFAMLFMFMNKGYDVIVASVIRFIDLFLDSIVNRPLNAGGMLGSKQFKILITFYMFNLIFSLTYYLKTSNN